MTRTDDAPRASALLARSRHGVFVVVVAWPGRQQAFAVAENDTVALVWKRPARANARERSAGFRRQILCCDFGWRRSFADGWERHQREQSAHKHAAGNGKHAALGRLDHEGGGSADLDVQIAQLLLAD